MRNRLGERVKALVSERGISQAEAARQCGLSPARFNNYVTGLRTPDPDTLIQIARGLGVTTDYLLGFNAAEPPNVSAVVLRLLELEGFDAGRAEAIAETVQEALKVLTAFPDEGDAATRSRLAAQAAWQLHGGSKPTQ